MGLGQRPDDGQSDPRAPAPTVTGGIGAVEALEDVRQMLSGNPLAVVDNGEHHLGADAGGGEPDVTPGGRMPQRVVEQVAQHLVQPLPVRPQPAGVTFGVELDALGGIEVRDRGAHRFHEITRVHPSRRDGGGAFLGLGQSGSVGREPHQPSGLLAQHRDGLGVKGFHPVLDGFQICLKHRHRCADLVGEITEQLTAGGLHRLEAFGHPVESDCQIVEFVAQLRRGDPNVVVSLGDRGRRSRQLRDRALQTPAQVGGDHERGQRGDGDRHRDRQRSGVLVGLLGVELLVGVVNHPGPVQVLAKQRRSDHGGHQPGGDPAREQDQRLGEQKPPSHPEAGRRAHSPVPIR